MDDDFDEALAKKEAKDGQRVTVIVADEAELTTPQRKQKPRHSNSQAAAAVCEDECGHQVEAIYTTQADERVSRPIPGTICATFEESTRSTVTRRPSDRLREKMTSCSQRTAGEAQQYKDTKAMDGTVSSACVSGVSEPQPSEKTAPPSISSSSAPGAYAIPGIGASAADEENRLNEVTQNFAAQVQDNPINAFVADDPVEAVALGSVDQQSEIPHESRQNSDDAKNTRKERKAFLSVAGIVSVTILVGILIGVLIARPNNEDDNEIICQAGKIWPTQSSPDATFPAEAVKLNTGMEFGQDLDIDGDTLIVGAREAEDEMKVAYVFDRVRGGKWVQNMKLEANSFVEPGFPLFSVAICGDFSFVGQSGDNPRGLRSGSVYVYERNDSNEWALDFIIYPNDGNDEDMFGSSIACDGKNLIVGAMHRHEQKEFESSHGDLEDANDRSHDGSAYIFSRQEGGDWVQTAKLLPMEGNFQQQFGTSVAINGEVAVVGSDKDDIGVPKAGSAHAYVLIGGVWTLAGVLLPENLQYGDRFGTSVDIDSAGNIIVGAKFRSSNIGSAYIFRRQGENNWVQEAALVASDGKVQSSFGISVALLSSSAGRNIALVGAWKDSELHDRSGAAYVYQRINDGTWNETKKLNPNELIRKSYFGNSVAIQEGENGDALEVFVGAGPLDTVYSFELCVDSN